jgi:hypothetical protein
MAFAISFDEGASPACVDRPRSAPTGVNPTYSSLPDPGLASAVMFAENWNPLYEFVTQANRSRMALSEVSTASARLPWRPKTSRPSSLSTPPGPGITMENSSQKRSSFRGSEHLGTESPYERGQIGGRPYAIAKLVSVVLMWQLLSWYLLTVLNAPCSAVLACYLFASE